MPLFAGFCYQPGGPARIGLEQAAFQVGMPLFAVFVTGRTFPRK